MNREQPIEYKAAWAVFDDHGIIIFKSIGYTQQESKDNFCVGSDFNFNHYKKKKGYTICRIAIDIDVIR